MTMEDYVSFETAKLLKEKGFDEFCRAHYDITNGNLYYEKVEVEASGCEMHNSVLAPTLQMAMKWLREVHNIHIQAFRYPGKIKKNAESNEYCKPWYYHYTSLNGINDIDMEFDVADDYDTYEDAINAAIKYCLESLI